MSEEALRAIAQQARNWGAFPSTATAPGAARASLLVAPPLPVTRGVGTPINPSALK